MAFRPHLAIILGLSTVLQLLSLSHSLPEEEATGELSSTPGWLGTDTETETTTSLQYREPRIDMRRVIQLSVQNPRAYLYKGFLPYDECDHLIGKASPMLQRSKVMANASSSGHVSEVRTSSGAFIPKGSDNVIKSIEKRIEEWTFLPIANHEPQQVLRYTEGQKYVPHHDYFPEPPEKLPGGQRYATVLMYLNNVTKGGETVFPAVKDSTPKDDSWSDCAKGYLAVKPEKGDALLFFSMNPDGTPDPNSLHYACPVVEGVKWSAPRWIRMRDFGMPPYDPNKCENSNEQCERWASVGECKKNPTYMLAACRLACGVCKPATSSQ